MDRRSLSGSIHEFLRITKIVYSFTVFKLGTCVFIRVSKAWIKELAKLKERASVDRVKIPAITLRLGIVLLLP